MGMGEFLRRINTTGLVRVNVGQVDFLMPVIVLDVKQSYGKTRWKVRPYPDSTVTNPAGIDAWVETVHFDNAR